MSRISICCHFLILRKKINENRLVQSLKHEFLTKKMKYFDKPMSTKENKFSRFFSPTCKIKLNKRDCRRVSEEFSFYFQRWKTKTTKTELYFSAAQS